MVAPGLDWPGGVLGNYLALLWAPCSSKNYSQHSPPAASFWYYSSCPFLLYPSVSAQLQCYRYSEEEELVKQPSSACMPQAHLSPGDRTRIHTALQRQAELFSCPINQWSGWLEWSLHSNNTARCSLFFFLPGLPKKVSKVNDRKSMPPPIHRSFIFCFHSSVSIAAAMLIQNSQKHWPWGQLNHSFPHSLLDLSVQRWE